VNTERLSNYGVGKTTCSLLPQNKLCFASPELARILVMAAYIALLQFTDQGVRNVKGKKSA
jgi:hypothetical protein